MPVDSIKWTELLFGAILGSFMGYLFTWVISQLRNKYYYKWFYRNIIGEYFHGENSDLTIKIKHFKNQTFFFAAQSPCAMGNVVSKGL